MAGTFSKLKQAYRLLRSVDFDQLGRIMEKVDLQALMNGFSKLDDSQLKHLQKLIGSNNKPQKTLPEINGDFYELSLRLSEEDRAVQLQVREFMEKEIAPIVAPATVAAPIPLPSGG